jgi:hypothetical protein
MWLQVQQESLEETRYAGENVHVAVYHGDGHPHVVYDEEGLGFGGEFGVEGEFDHAQFGG